MVSVSVREACDCALCAKMRASVCALTPTLAVRSSLLPHCALCSPGGVLSAGASESRGMAQLLREQLGRGAGEWEVGEVLATWHRATYGEALVSARDCLTRNPSAIAVACRPRPGRCAQPHSHAILLGFTTVPARCLCTAQFPYALPHVSRPKGAVKLFLCRLPAKCETTPRWPRVCICVCVPVCASCTCGCQGTTI